VLREKLGKRRILLNDEQRRRLAVKGRILDRRALRELASIVTPDTILRWHRELVAKKWDYSHLKSLIGRPRTKQESVELVVLMARENPTWGYDRIQGGLKNIGVTLTDTTVGNILREHGLEPAPDRERKTTWKVFLRALSSPMASHQSPAPSYEVSSMTRSSVRRRPQAVSSVTAASCASSRAARKLRSFLLTESPLLTH
jgi:transposase